MKKRILVRKSVPKVSVFLMFLVFTMMSLHLIQFTVKASTNFLSSSLMPIVDSGATNYTQCQVGDFDNDGDLDVLMQDGGAGTDVPFRENNGSGWDRNLLFVI